MSELDQIDPPMMKHDEPGWWGLRHPDGWWLGDEVGVYTYANEMFAKLVKTIQYHRGGSRGSHETLRLVPTVYKGVPTAPGEQTTYQLTPLEAIKKIEGNSESS